jgi:hypothetical protein
MVRLTREALDERRKGWSDLRSELGKTAERSRELLGRFTGDNFMEAVVVRRLGVCQKEIEVPDEDQAGGRGTGGVERDDLPGGPRSTILVRSALVGRFRNAVHVRACHRLALAFRRPAPAFVMVP